MLMKSKAQNKMNYNQINSITSQLQLPIMMQLRMKNKTIQKIYSNFDFLYYKDFDQNQNRLENNIFDNINEWFLYEQRP